MVEVAALIVAAGRGRRFGDSLPKQYCAYRGEPILRHALRAFADHERVNHVVTVIHPDDHELYAQAAAGLAIDAPVRGGASRQDSVRLGLEALADTAPDMVLIHDGARPHVGAGLIADVVAALKACPGAVPAIPVADTLKRVSGGIVEATVERKGLWRAQTPQGFRFSDILSAHRRARGRELTDDAAVAELAGLDVAIVAGSRRNVKITKPEDLAMGERPENAGWEYRTGQGFDVHRFEAGTSVRLCGVSIPHDRRLAGHSDADVGLHALTDAILGAVGAGDIGEHFPPSDPQWRGAASDAFVVHALGIVRGLAAEVVNVDVTLVCEAPKVGPHRAAMRQAIAEMLDIHADRVGVKATTTEKLGFTGRREGIAAQALATVRLPVEDWAPGKP